MRSSALFAAAVTTSLTIALLGACGGDDKASAGSDPDGSVVDPGSGGEGGSMMNKDPVDGSTIPVDMDGGSIVVTQPDGATSSCPVPDAASRATISSYIDKLPAGPPAAGDPLRAQIVDAIYLACEMFGAPLTVSGWKREYCWAHMASAIQKESTYKQTSVITDSYATRTVMNNMKANDPTIGFTQIRFSSTVHDMVRYGSLDRLACVGCQLPAAYATHATESGDSPFWSVTGPTADLPLMESAACNIGMGAWYYYGSSTSNGNPSTTTYISDYCGGKGTAGNLVTGFRSYVDGPTGGRGVIPDMNGVNALMSTDKNVYNYITAIKGYFDTMITPMPSPHPFFITLPPNKVQYCQ